MRVEFANQAGQVRFELHEVDPRLEPVLDQCFWQHSDGVWHRSYPGNAAHLDATTARFRRYANEMFEQLAYLRPVPWEQALLAFADQAQSAGLRWWLTGSVAACVRGVPLAPHDVDIMIDHADVGAVTEAFSRWWVEPLVDTGGWLTRDFGVLFRHARIDIASDPSAALDDPEPIDCGPYARDHLEPVAFRGRTILVPPLALQVAANRRRGRRERVEVLQLHAATSASRRG